MKKAPSPIRFEATLFRTRVSAKARADLYVTVPKAGAKISWGDKTKVQGTINGCPFPRVPLESDRRGNLLLRVNWYMRKATGVETGESVAMELAPAGEEPEPKVPADLRKALANAPKARVQWTDITRIARRDWVLWVEDAKLAATRANRVNRACSMLASGKRRVCCFDSYRAQLDKLLRTKPGA